MRPASLGIVASLLLVLSAAPALAQMGPSSVVVAPVERRTIELTQPLVASVEPVTRTELASQEAWLVAERFFDEGQRLEKGAVLVKGNVDLINALAAAANAQLASAEARRREALAQQANDKRERERIEGLFRQNVVSEKEVNDAKTREEVSAAQVDTRAAEIEEKRAEIERLKVLLSRAEVRSPLSGVVTRRYVEVGQWVEVGEPIADLVQLDPLHVRVSVPESVISRLKPGDPAKITFDALGREALTGKIDQIIPSADPSSRTYPVKILLPNPEHRVWPGFFGRAVLTSQSQDPAFLVPRDAVISGGQVPHRVVVAREGKAVVVPVSLGAGVGDKVAVTGELTESDQVIVRGNEALRGGEQLMILNAPPPGGTPPASQPAQQQQQQQTARK